jgi:hypothetical protein
VIPIGPIPRSKRDWFIVILPASGIGLSGVAPAMAGRYSARRFYPLQIDRTSPVTKGTCHIKREQKQKWRWAPIAGATGDGVIDDAKILMRISQP